MHKRTNLYGGGVLLGLGFGFGFWLFEGFLEDSFPARTQFLVGEERNGGLFGDAGKQDGGTGLYRKLFIGFGRMENEEELVFAKLGRALGPEERDGVKPGFQLLLGFSWFSRTGAELGKEARRSIQKHATFFFEFVGPPSEPDIEIERGRRFLQTTNSFHVDGDAASTDQIGEFGAQHDQILPKPVGVWFFSIKPKSGSADEAKAIFVPRRASL